MRALVLLFVVGCSGGGSTPAFPPPAGTTFTICEGVESGESCSTVGWCHSASDCSVLEACYCTGSAYQCTATETLCDFGEGAHCALEGNAACHTPPVGGVCSCSGGQTKRVTSCPLPECPDYDPGREECTCADGSCP